jgi:hypothetical protein
VRDVFPRLDHTVSAHCREDVVLGLERVAIMYNLKVFNPKLEPAEGIACREI